MLWLILPTLWLILPRAPEVQARELRPVGVSLLAHWSRVKSKVEDTTSETARNEAMRLDVSQDHFFFLSPSSEGHAAPAVTADELSFPGLTGMILYLWEGRNEIPDYLSSHFHAKERDQSR